MISPPKDEPTNECQSLSTFVVCLEYLLQEARKDNLHTVALILEEALKGVSCIALETYSKTANEEISSFVEADLADGRYFIKKFSKITDPELKKKLADRLHDLDKNILQA